MRAMRAETFSGYEALKLVEVTKPTISDGRVLVRITTAGVTPLDFTILSGKFSRAKAPLVLGNEGTGVGTDGGGTDLPAGSRVMFTGPYGVAEDGSYSEWVAVRKQDLCLIPDNVGDVSAAGVPVAYLTAGSGANIGGRDGRASRLPRVHTASTAFQMVGAVWSLTRKGRSENWFLPMRRSSSMPAIVVAAQS